jgi:hypothetical protein
MGKLITGICLVAAAGLLFFPAMMISIMSSDSSPKDATTLPVYLDLSIGAVGLLLIAWWILARVA